jgi:hypothetical protein
MSTAPEAFGGVFVDVGQPHRLCDRYNLFHIHQSLSTAAEPAISGQQQRG